MKKVKIAILKTMLNEDLAKEFYFCEYRNYGGSRELVVTIIGE